MKRNIYSATVTCLAVILILTTNLLAQSGNNGSNSSGGTFSLNYSSEIGGFYFQDLSGIQIALEGVPYENKIDQNTYILGVNDLISIEVESTQRVVLKNLLINSSGDIIIPSFGVIGLNGLTVTEAVKKLEEKLAEVYKTPSVILTVDVPRRINVHISGSVPNPGKFTLPAQSRVDLAILQSIKKIDPTNQDENYELPSTFLFTVYTSQLLQSNEYSIRNIVIYHKDGSTSKADLVRYFRTGDLASNPIVRDGDRIQIPRISRNSPTVSISGAVRYGYELDFKPNETISELLSIAEFFEENADSSQVFVFRRDGGKVDKLIIQSSNWNSFKLEPNDRVIVPELNITRLTSSAWVRGEVSYPGNYPIIAGETTLQELLEISGGMTPSALPSASYLIRAGSIKNEIPNKFNSDLMSRTSDQYYQGIEYLKQETSLSKNRVYINLRDPQEIKSVILFHGDQLYIPRDEKTIFVFGQVNNPGYFPFLKSQDNNVQDYIQRAGGFALSADEERVFIIKAGNASWFKPGETDLESGDRIFVDRVPVEDLNALRNFEIQKQQVKNTRIQLIMTGITTITGIITTYVAIRNIR